MAAISFTGNFSHTPVGPNFLASSNASPTALYNQLYFQIFGDFSQFFLKCSQTFCNFKLKNKPPYPRTQKCTNNNCFLEFQVLPEQYYKEQSILITRILDMPQGLSINNISLNLIISVSNRVNLQCRILPYPITTTSTKTAQHTPSSPALGDESIF